MVAWQGAPDDLDNDDDDDVPTAEDTVALGPVEEALEAADQFVIEDVEVVTVSDAVDAAPGDVEEPAASLRADPVAVEEPDDVAQVEPFEPAAAAAPDLDFSDFDRAPASIVLEPPAVAAEAPPAPAATASFDVWTEPAPVIELPRREALSALRDIASELGSLGKAGLSWG